MIYRETERSKAERIRNDFFKDEGGGEYKKSPRPFVLQDAKKNLWYKVRNEAIHYFSSNKIVWWPGGNELTGHLLSSQICALNHLFFLRGDQEAALLILKNINSDFVEVCPDFEGGYIGFEVVSNKSYLGEVPNAKQQTRGATCTSVDAMMSGILKNGKKIQILIEWKYTEYYSKECKADGSSGETRCNRYNELIDNVDSPILRTVDLNNFYYEPFYQLMRQTLLAWQMVIHKDQELGAEDWLHLDVIPENNLKLRYEVQAPDLIQSGIEEAWKSQLKEPEKYNIITPQKLLKPLLFSAKYKGLINYLNERYW